jgi:hypothetical protein
VVADFSDVTPSSVTQRLQHFYTFFPVNTSSFAPLQNSQWLSLVCSQPHSPSSFPYHFHLFSQSPTLRMEAVGSYKMVVHVTSTNINYIWQAGSTSKWQVRQLTVRGTVTSLKACGNCIWYSHNTQELDASWVIVVTNTSFLVFLRLTYKFNLMFSCFHPTKWCSNENSLFIHATKHQCILLQTLYILQQVHILITVFQCSCGCLIYNNNYTIHITNSKWQSYHILFSTTQPKQICRFSLNS